MMLYVVVVNVRGFGGLVLRSLRNPLGMSANFGCLGAFIWFVNFDLWPCAHATYGGIRVGEGYVGSFLAVDHTTGSLVGDIVVDDAGVRFDNSYVGGVSF